MIIITLRFIYDSFRTASTDLEPVLN